jgi:hypothetical protein
MQTRSQCKVLALLGIVAMLALLAAPTAHDHVGKPGSVCHVCSTAQTVILTATAMLLGPARRIVGLQNWTTLHRSGIVVVSQRIPRAPPA